MHTLRRVQLGPLHLGSLPAGAARPLTSAEVLACYQEAMPSVIFDNSNEDKIMQKNKKRDNGTSVVTIPDMVPLPIAPTDAPLLSQAACTEALALVSDHTHTQDTG